MLTAIQNSPVNDNIHAYPTFFAFKPRVILPHFIHITSTIMKHKPKLFQTNVDITQHTTSYLIKIYSIQLIIRSSIKQFNYRAQNFKIINNFINSRFKNTNFSHTFSSNNSLSITNFPEKIKQEHFRFFLGFLE